MIQMNKFHKIGELMAMSIPQQGSGLPFFSMTTYNYLSKSNSDIRAFEVILEDIPDPEVRAFLEEVRT